MSRYLFLIICFTIGAHASVLSQIPKYVNNWDRNGRIIGGEPADIRDAPYQVAMLYMNDDGIARQVCGGSLIGSTIIISAAHCNYGTISNDWRVRVGSTSSDKFGEVSTVIRIHYPREFEMSTIDYDISMFILPLPVNVNGVTVALIRKPIQNAPVDEGDLGLVTGWGATLEGGSSVVDLRKVTLSVVDQQRCIEAYQGINNVTSRMFCAGDFDEGGVDACNGDSGGAFNYNGILVGITSWGLGCGRAGYPGVWTRVASFRNWIDQQYKSNENIYANI